MRSARHQALLGAVIVGTVAAGLGVATVGPASAASGCRVSYQVTSSWNGGFGATVAVTNLGDPVNGWVLNWSFAAGQSITQTWNATTAQNGAEVTARSVGHNAAIATNDTVSFGFNGAWTGSNPAPTGFTLNGVECLGTGGPTSEPSSPTPLSPAATPPATPPPPPAQYAGYLFSYFTGEGSSTGERIYFALSNGNDPLHWRQLNAGQSVLTSTVGTRGVRDPFIIRSPQGDKFYQIATDLRMYGSGDWDGAQRRGSTSIVVWESTDLVNWTDQRLVRVAPATAGNVWAPEAFYDPTISAFVVFWASKIYAANDPNHTGSTHNRIMYATTRDFRTFTPAQEWYNPGYSVIDSTLLEHNGAFYRYTKDERNTSSSTPCGKFIMAQKSSTVLGSSYQTIATCIGRGTISRGEGPLVFKSNTAEKWYMFIDEFGGRGYVPFETTNLASGQWTMSSNYSLPSQPRHGTVLPVTQAEYNRLLGTFN